MARVGRIRIKGKDMPVRCLKQKEETRCHNLTQCKTCLLCFTHCTCETAICYCCGKDETDCECHCKPTNWCGTCNCCNMHCICKAAIITNAQGGKQAFIPYAVNQ